MLVVPRHDTESALERRGSDERVGEASPELTCDSPGSLSDLAVDVHLAKRCEQLRTKISGRVAREQLGLSDD